MPLVPFINSKPVHPRASYWDGCEVATGGDGKVRIIGPHGAVEYPPGTEFRDVNIPAHWPPPVEPAEWEDEITDATREGWQAQAHEMNGARIAPRAAALAWIADTDNDGALMKEWEAMCEQAGIEWPGSGTKASRIVTVRDAAALLALDLGLPWGSP